MDTLISALSFLFWPNPANADYGSPKVVALMILCGLLIVGAFALSFWRKRMKNPVTKKLSRSWGVAAFWFGLSGLILIVSRVEQIQFVSMRFLWVIWIAIAAFYVYIQVRLFRARHYEVLPREASVDPRSKYLPRKKK